MSWLFSQALVEEYSAATSWDGEPFVPLSVMPTQHKFWRNDKMMDASLLSQFGLTCAVLTGDLGEDLLTWFRVDFLAKTSPRQGKEQESKDIEAVCGQKWRGSFAKYDQNLCTWKTHQCSLLGDLEEFSGTWPRWGLMHNGECWEAITQDLPIVEIESGFLPTPRASVGTHGICWKRAETGEHRSQIEDFLGWMSIKNGGKVVLGRTVNAEFQDWLMGWPSGWTDLKPLEMDKFQKWRQQHFICSLGNEEIA